MIEHTDHYRGWIIRPDCRPGRAPDALRADLRGVTLASRTRLDLERMIDTRKKNDPPTRGPETRITP